MLTLKKHKKSYAILLVNLLLIILVVVLYNATEQVIKTDKEERHLTKINLYLDSVLIFLKDAQRGERGFVISGNETYLETFFNAKTSLSRIVGDLETSLNGQNEVQQNFISSKRLMKNTLAKFDEIIRIRKKEGAVLETLAQRDYEGKLFIDTLQNNIRTIENFEKNALDNGAKESLSRLQEIAIMLIICGLMIVFIVVLLSVNLVRDNLKKEELRLQFEGSEKRYNFLFELSDDGIIVADLAGIITDCNTAACKIFGYSKEELIGKSYHIIWQDEPKQPLPQKISRNTITGDVLIERTYLRKDGTILNTEVYTKLIEINGLSNVVAHIRNITDKKQAQTTIAKKEEKYRNLFERNLAGILRATIEGQIIECNNEFVKMLGFNSIEDISKISTKSLYADLKEREKLIELLRKQGEVKDYVMKMKKKDGSYVWVNDSLSIMYDEELQKEVLFGTLIDITELKHTEEILRLSEEKFHKIFQLSPTAMSMENSENVFIEINDNFINLTEYSKEEIIGYSANELNLWANDDERNCIHETFKNKNAIQDLEFKFRKKSGKIGVGLMSAELIAVAGEVFTLTSVSDITTQKEAELLLVASEKKYRNFVELLPQTVIELDFYGKITFANKNGLSMFGYTEEDRYLGMNAADFFVSEQRESLQNRIRGVLQGNKQPFAEYTALKKDGTKMPCTVFSERIIDNITQKPIGIRTILIDLTEQKKIQMEIALLAQAIKSITELVFITNFENEITFVNDAFVKAYGYSREELIGRNIDLVKAKGIEGRTSSGIFETTFKDNFNGEMLTRRKDGSVFPVDLITAIIKDNDGNPKALIGIAVDITNRKQAEENLCRSEQKYRDIFRWAPVGIYQSNADGTFLTVNNSLVKILGYESKKELMSQNLQKNIYYSEEERAKLISISDTKKHRAVLDLEVLWKKKDGTPVWISLTTHAIRDDAGKTNYYEGFVYDISKRRLAEEKLRKSELLFHTLAKNSPVGIFRTNADGYTTYVNPMWCQLSDMPAEEALGDGWLKAVHPDDKKGIAEGWKEATEKKRHSNTEYRFIRSDESVVWVMGQAIPELNAEKEIQGYVGTITDITDIKSYQRELIKSKEKIETANKLKDAFINNMSHEIRTPLNGILGLSSIIKETYSQHVAKEEKFLFTGIDISARRIIRTVDMVLNYSRLQTGDYTIDTKEINLLEICELIINQNKTNAEKQNLELIVDNRCIDVKIVGDVYSITQVVSNLVDNAIKFTKKGFVKVTLFPGKTGEATLEIKDTGIGINEEYLEHLFEPYRQEDMGYGRAYEGVGLGLSLVKKFLDLNNAHISVESKKGEGTTFTVTFTKAVKPKEETAVPVKIITKVEPKDGAQNHLVLIVEDDIINQVMITRLLKPRYNSLVVSSAGEVFDILKKNKVDIILMDISIDGSKNGLELTRELKAVKDYQNIPIIAVTAHAFERDRQNALEAGCDDYIAKPFSAKLLFDAIGKFV